MQKSLPYFFALVFIATVTGALSGYPDHNPWKIGDWLINYQGGMIRRGFLGEVFYRLAYFTHIKSWSLCVAVQHLLRFQFDIIWIIRAEPKQIRNDTEERRA